MLVLLREDNLPPMVWRPAIISETFPGSDGHVRVVTVKTSSGQFKRPIHKLVVLPIGGVCLSFQLCSRLGRGMCFLFLCVMMIRRRCYL
jgi:hypothetical protein